LCKNAIFYSRLHFLQFFAIFPGAQRFRLTKPPRPVPDIVSKNHVIPQKTAKFIRQNAGPGLSGLKNKAGFVKLTYLVVHRM